MDAGQLLTLLLGGGCVATITAFFKGFQSLRDGARARDKDAVQDLIDRRKESDEDRDRAVDERDYWRNRCGVREFQLASNGIKLAPFPDPPSEVR